MSNNLHPSSAMTSQLQPRPGSSIHPRRRPANRSVSLLHSTRRKLPPKGQSDSSSDSAVMAGRRDAAASGSPSSLQPLARDSSGESSNADKWFERSNNAPHDQSAPFADNDPPFFMRHSSSSETPPDVQQQRLRQALGLPDGPGSLPLRAGLLQLGTDGGSSEDFRGVIDDLTIENKKLKRRLKKYEKLHDAHLKDEKLFEVRIHGLPPDKKRELEETLRKFAVDLNPRRAAQFPANGYEGLMPLLNNKKATSSQTSLQNADSAYASMSASGQGSSARSGNDSKHSRLTHTSSARRQKNNQNIQSYLHHIPEGLLPQTSPANMTERAKKKLVVRRLEQLFAGKHAPLVGHQQPLQQQEVSQMAARADRSALEAAGKSSLREGKREALIMAKELDDGRPEATAPLQPNNAMETTTGQQDFAGRSPLQSTVDQRPTRPLDLDPHRAQVPAENIRYMRHLGFSPLDPESRAAQAEGHGWIYLNFLMNMAQLHTLNVTTDFVTQAIREYSTKFEVGHDERKVRWRNGRDGKQTSSSGGDSFIDRTSDEVADGQSPRKRPRLTQRESTQSSLMTRGGASREKLVYTPLFFHKDDTEDTDSSSSSSEEEEEDTTSSPFPRMVGGESSNMTSSGVRTTSTKKKVKHNKNDGPIIFYHNAKFCTDLSGEQRSQGNADAPPYVKLSTQPVGKTPLRSGPRAEKKGPLNEAAELPDPMDLGDNPIPEAMELSFPPVSPIDSKKRQTKPRDPIELQVTGIGGVWPADNFAIDVESRNVQVSHGVAPAVSNDFKSRHIPAKLNGLLRGDSEAPRGTKRAAIHKEVISANLKALPPSRLPEALAYMSFGYEDSSSDEEAEDDDVSISPDLDATGALPPSAAPQPLSLGATPYDDDEEDEDEDDDESSGDESDVSLDLLAAARELDPEAIRAREREYDANMAERLAEEIPAGSSAATAGGGSGFASPASGVDKQEYRRAQAEARGNVRPSMVRAKTSDSMVVQGVKAVDETSDNDEDEKMSDIGS